MSRFRVLLILLALALGQGLLYAYLIPPWQSPDEPAHFEATQLLAQKGYWFDWEEYKQTPLNEELLSSLDVYRFWEYRKRERPPADLLNGPADIARQTLIYDLGGPITASNYPPLYYLLVSVVYKAVASLDIVVRLYALRLVSVAITTITIPVAFVWAGELFPEDKILAASIPAFAILLPMHAAINSTITSDVLAELLATLTMFVAVLSLKHGVNWWRLSLLVILLILGVMTKRTTFFLIPTLVVLVLIQYVVQQRLTPRIQFTLYMGSILIALLVVSSLTILGTRYSNELAFLGVFNFAGVAPQSVLSLFDARHLSSTALLTYRDSAWIAFLTFWGDFGWAEVPVHAFMLRGLEILSGLIGVGAILFVLHRLVRRERSNLQPWQRQSLVVMLFAILFLVGSAFAPILISLDMTFAPHARYFFPAIVPIATFLLLGVCELFPSDFPHRRWVPLFFVGLLGLYNMYCILFLVAHFYRLRT